VSRIPKKDATDFGKRLSYYRRKSGLSQEALAKRMGISRDTISYYEIRAKNPTIDFVLKASKFLNTSVESLVSGTAPKKSSVAKKK
jgi:transcriptional regulator with XRE-family HTH domain